MPALQCSQTNKLNTNKINLEIKYSVSIRVKSVASAEKTYRYGQRVDWFHKSLITLYLHIRLCGICPRRGLGANRKRSLGLIIIITIVVN